MGRHHHSFLDSLKDFGHQVEHASPAILSTLSTASKFTPAGIITSIALDPRVDKLVMSGINKAGDEIKVIGKEIKTVGNEAISLGKSGVSGIFSFGKNLEMYLMIGGAVFVLYLIKK